MFPTTGNVYLDFTFLAVACLTVARPAYWCISALHAAVVTFANFRREEWEYTQLAVVVAILSVFTLKPSGAVVLAIPIAIFITPGGFLFYGWWKTTIGKHATHLRMMWFGVLALGGILLGAAPTGDTFAAMVQARSAELGDNVFPAYIIVAVFVSALVGVFLHARHLRVSGIVAREMRIEERRIELAVERRQRATETTTEEVLA